MKTNLKPCMYYGVEMLNNARTLFQHPDLDKEIESFPELKNYLDGTRSDEKRKAFIFGLIKMAMQEQFYYSDPFEAFEKAQRLAPKP